MQAVLGMNLPEHAGRIPVFPNQLKVGHEYLHLFVGGLRQRANLAARRMVHRIPEPQLEHVKIVHIADQAFGGMNMRFVQFKSLVDDWTTITAFPYTNENDLRIYPANSTSIFFRLDPMNRRGPILNAWNTPRSGSGGRRRRSTRRRKNRTRK